MKPLKPITLGVIALFFTTLWITPICAAGLLTPTGSNLPQLEIREHHVNVVIEDGYAITSVEQVFANPHANDLEAIYSFPVPEKAAVGEFTYWIDGLPVTGEVLEKQQAREIYQQEKQAGRETALTEQDSYRTFDIAVYPVRAGQDVRISLTYIQPVHIDTSIGRYVYPLEEGGVDEQKMSFWSYQDS
ncbi:MAG: VIT domain-containing protein, partial [Xanthomonadales bacterium]|nr:VIT domain-containing protein [Xanthomonadales bacterium]